MALSKTDKRRCCDTCRPYRSVKLDFSHLLSGGPNSQAEASEHARSSITEGYGLDINSVIEYNNRFGLECAPFSEFKGTYATNHDFNCMSLILRGRNVEQVPHWESGDSQSEVT
eukprot:Plantae.Rhodophyta-Rhodochaete_pulchella.ctg21240.p2 GENE.Plantae.Rhodophyta-Rhodochaete_pulchella.ctg21240~~Plantae.Rhodophyta-Rhodochaete_pulchella.ctg21240.p2  ORF type:complete len:114 (+),score=4.10 Plantae.Rhodophyta-Rhodochaete_pulchella.ctg21240:359-700(+)